MIAALLTSEPDGWLRCRACVPDAPVPVVVVNQVKQKSFLPTRVLPTIVLGVILGQGVKACDAKQDKIDADRALRRSVLCHLAAPVARQNLTRSSHPTRLGGSGSRSQATER
ncbi:MAG: hypothetical protein M3619_00730 [Myxococcota bacterium]|nr:hypothetical protein [Myxococcota bacterium]